MSQPIENETFALSVLSKLRSYKILSVAASRMVASSDFGRTLFIQSETYIVTLQSLDRSGCIRFLRNNGGKIHFGDATVFDCNAFEDIVHNPSEDYDINLNYFQYVDLIYNHSENRWYLYRQQRTVGPETVDGVDATQLAFKLPLYNSAGRLFADSFHTLESVNGLIASYGPNIDGSIWMSLSGDNGNLDIVPPADIQNNNIVTFSPDASINGNTSYFMTHGTTGYANDAAAALGGVLVGYPYFNTSTGSSKIRMA